MIALLEDGLKAGALGMSSGLFTSPGSYAQPDEMIALGHVLKRYNAGYFTHLRDESNKVLEARGGSDRRRASSAASTSRSCTSSAPAWTTGARPRPRCKMIADARARGLDVDCDSYPYAAGCNPLKNLLPQWVQAGGVDAMLERLPEHGDARAHPRRHRARRPQQLGPHPVTGTACRSRSRRTCRNTPAAPSPRSRRSAAPIRSTRCATISSTTKARPACWSPRSPRTTSPRSCARPPRWSAPTAIASRPTAR